MASSRSPPTGRTASPSPSAVPGACSSARAALARGGARLRHLLPPHHPDAHVHLPSLHQRQGLLLRLSKSVLTEWHTTALADMLVRAADTWLLFVVIGWRVRLCRAVVCAR